MPDPTDADVAAAEAWWKERYGYVSSESARRYAVAGRLAGVMAERERAAQEAEYSSSRNYLGIAAAIRRGPQQ